MQEDLESVKKELALARTEIEELRLRLSNALLMLRKEMLISGTLTLGASAPGPAKDDKVSG